MIKLKTLGNERGGVEVMIFFIISLLFIILVMIHCLDYMLLYNTQNKLKNDLNSAVHAASLSIDEEQLSQGYFKLDTTTPETRAQDIFYRYLRLNMNLDNNNMALPGSTLKPGTAVIIDELLYVDYEAGSITNLSTSPTKCTYDGSTSKVTCSVTLNSATSMEITRTVDQTIIGPSVVAIINTTHEGIGIIPNEPLLIPAVQEVYFVK